MQKITQQVGEITQQVGGRLDRQSRRLARRQADRLAREGAAMRALRHLSDGPAARRRQRGFTLIEVSIVTAIVLLIAIIGIPAIGGYVMENKVPKVGQELARFVMHTRINAGSAADAPYDEISTASLAAMAADSTVLTVAGDGSVLHGLGSGGTVEVASAENGAAFEVRLKKVNHVACPAIASVLQRVSDRITVGADEGAGQTVKDATTPFSALAAEAACTKGDVNQFVFHVS